MYSVLLVDDDLAALYMLKRFKKWGEYGFSLEGEACDGKEALRKLAGKEYDLIITDIKMPGMDGIEFVQELRGRKDDTCIVFWSTHSDFQFARQGIRFGVFEYMTKPLEEAALTDILVRAGAFLAEKKAREERLKSSGKAQEEDNGVYYPVDHENLIISYILTADPRLKEATAETFREICNLYDRDSGKVRVLANTLLYNIKTRIDEKFPWLKKVEGPIVSGGITGSGEISPMEEEFSAQLSEIKEKILKYQLNHSDSIIRRICQCVIDNIESEVNLEFIANEVHISKDYVGKLFKQKVMCNFNDYVTKMKMEHAKYLILSGDLKNYEISERLGYKKADYFSSLFKAYTGLTPSEYKKCNSQDAELQI